MAKNVTRLMVNGHSYEMVLEPQWTLSFVLRNKLGLTGSKEACGEGACGACTVIVDGRAVPSCMMLAIEQEGKNIETIEGLLKQGRAHLIQEAWRPSLRVTSRGDHFQRNAPLLVTRNERGVGMRYFYQPLQRAVQFTLPMQGFDPFSQNIETSYIDGLRRAFLSVFYHLSPLPCAGLPSQAVAIHKKNDVENVTKLAMERCYVNLYEKIKCS